MLRLEAAVDGSNESATSSLQIKFSDLLLWGVMLLMTVALCVVFGFCRQLKTRMPGVNELMMRRTINFHEDLINDNEMRHLWSCGNCEFANYAHKTHCSLCGCERLEGHEEADDCTPKRGSLTTLSQTATMLTSSRASEILVSSSELSRSDGPAANEDSSPSSSFCPMLSPTVSTPSLSPRAKRKEWRTVLNKRRQLVWTRQTDPFDLDTSTRTEELIAATAFVSRAAFESSSARERLTITPAENALVCPLHFERLSESLPTFSCHSDDEESSNQAEHEDPEATDDMDEDFYGVGWMRSKPFPEKHRWFLRRASAILNARWGNPTMSKLDTKLITSRAHGLLETAVAALASCSEEHLRRPLRVEFENEPALDAGGVAREWYGLVAKEFLDDRHGLFEAVHVTANSVYSANEAGGSLAYAINPKASLTVKDHHLYYRAFGRFMGKALLEGHLIQLPMTNVIFKHILGEPISFADLVELDGGLARSIQQLWDSPSLGNQTTEFTDEEDLYGLDFSVFHTAKGTVDLKPNGRNICVTTLNRREYVKLFVQWHLARSAAEELKEIVLGVHDVLPAEMLAAFDFAELRLLLCGLPVLDLDDWRANTVVAGNLRRTKATHLTRWFWSVLTSFSTEDRERILQFVTGSCRVPVHGFKALTTSDGRLCPFTLHWLPRSECSCPRAHTCFNRLDHSVSTL